MEMASDRQQKTLINELTRGRELANQLRTHLDKTTSRENCDFLLENILSSYEKALSVLNWSSSLVAGEPSPAVLPPSTLDSPPHNSQLAGGSPRSEASDRDSKDQYYHKDVLKKRKTLPRWSEQVRICSGTGMEGSGIDGPLGDGYSWRKYGQKDILGANFPRAYYRCTHRHAQGCLATKQVQRSDEDSSIFEITYRGRHTCVQASHLSTALAAFGKKEEPMQNKDHCREIQKQSQEIVFFNFGSAGLKTEDLGEIFPSFSFPATPIESENVESHFFPEYLKENNFMGSYSPSFISPEISESNYFSLSPCHMNNFEMGHNLQSSDSDLTEIISAQNSVTNSPIGDLDFSLDPVDFENNFLFEIPE